MIERLTAIGVAVCLVATPLGAHAGPADPDTAFSGDGVAIVDVSLDDGGRDAAIDGSGRTVTVGFTMALGGRSQVMVARHTAAGAGDRQFSGDGIAAFDLGRPAYGTAVELDSAGRIVIAATVGDPGTDIAVMRLTSDGSLDPSFSGDGIAIADLGSLDLALDLTVDASNRPIVAGASDGSAVVARFSTSGALDAGFSGDGVVAVGPGGQSRSTSIAAVGETLIVAGISGAKLFVTRLTASGSKDGGFGSGGVAIVSAGSSGVAAAVSANGSTTLAGSHAGNLVVARLSPTGSLDRSFSGDGVVVSDLGATETAGGVALDSKSRVVVTGTRTTLNGSDALVAAFTPEGTLDRSYSSDGWTTINLGGDEVLAGSSADGSGSIVVAGQRFTTSGSSMLTLLLSGSDGPGPRPADDPFVDDDGSIFEHDIEALAAAGITKGCNPPVNDRFCPDDPVTRGQMAAFLVRALGYSDRHVDAFTDDDESIFEADIERLAAADVTRGCNPPANDRFCPADAVTRGQMAAFLVRALGYTDAGDGDLFVDDDGSVFEGDIDKLGVAGVTKGCNPPTNDRFCPDDRVTRGQMAAFLVRALDLG